MILGKWFSHQRLPLRGGGALRYVSVHIRKHVKRVFFSTTRKTCFLFRGLKKLEKGVFFLKSGESASVNFKKKGVVFVTAGLKVWAQTYLGVKFGIKTPSFTGVVCFFFSFLFVLFCCCWVFFAWKDKTCLVISFTSDVHVYTITSKCPPHPDCRKRNDFSRPVARIDWGKGAGPQKGGPFWTSPPYPSCKNPIL